MDASQHAFLRDLGPLVGLFLMLLLWYLRWGRSGVFGKNNRNAIAIGPLKWGVSPDQASGELGKALVDYEMYRARVDYDSRFQSPGSADDGTGAVTLYLPNSWMYGRYCDLELKFARRGLCRVRIDLGLTDDETDKVTAKIRSDLLLAYKAQGERTENGCVISEFSAEGARARIETTQITKADYVRRAIMLTIEHPTIPEPAAS